MRDIDDTQQPLLEHLIELRRRLLYCVAALLVTFAASMYFSREVLSILVHPLAEAGQKKIIYTQVFGAFFVQLKVAFFAAMMLSFPVIATQLWQFVAPGLYRREKKALLPFLLATPVLFFSGAAFAYYLVMPTAFHFFLKFQGEQGGLNVEALPSMDSYLSLVMQFILAFGISFLLPVLVMLLNRAGIVSRAQLVGARRYVIVGAVVVAAVLTPPDVISQLMLAIPLCLLYELALIAIWFTDRREAKERDRELVKTD